MQDIKKEMKRLLFFCSLCAFVCSLIGMYKGYEEDYVRQQEANFFKGVWVKTCDDKMIKIPVWQIDQIQKLQEHLLGQKDKNSEKNPINIADIMIREATELKQLVITVDMLQSLVSAFKNSGSSENFSSFFMNLDKDTQKKLINTAGVLGANKILSLSVPMIFPQELYKEIGIGDDKIGLVVSYLKSFEKRVFKEHAGLVTCVACSRDGKYAISGSDDGVLILWNMQTSEQIKTFQGTSEVKCVAYSPDGKYIVSGSLDKVLFLWDVQTGKQIRVLRGHAHAVICVAYSPDGKYIVSGSLGKDLVLWNVQTGEQIRMFEGHTGLVRSVAYSPDGKYIIAGLHDETLILSDACTGEQIISFKGCNSGILCVAYSPDGKYVVSGLINKVLILWDVNTGKQIRCFKGHGGWISCVTYSPDGKYIVSGSVDAALILWDVQTGKQIRTFTGHTMWVSCVAYSPNGRYIVSGARDKTLILRSIIDERVLEHIANKLKVEQKEFVYRLYEATVREISIVLDPADPDYMVYQLLPIDVQGLIRTWFPFHLLGCF